MTVDAIVLDLIYGYGVDWHTLTVREQAEAIAWWEWRQTREAQHGR